MRVLVTGGAGFIGSHIVDLLLAGGHEVAVLDNLSTGKRENVRKEVRFYETDLRDRDAVFKAVAEFRPVAVSHQAAQASVAISVREPVLDANVNVIGGLNLLDACTTGTPVERFVFAGTGGAIYGEVPEGSSADEDMVPVPVSPYAIHKQTLERHLGVYREHRGLDSITLRYANVYGPRQDPYGEAGVVAIFIDAVLAGRALRVNARKTSGDDGCVRDYVYVADVASANLLAITKKEALPERVLNVGTGVSSTTRELARKIIAIAGREVLLEPGPHRPGDLERSVLDPRRLAAARARAGQAADPVDLSTGLEKTYESMKG